MEELIPPHNQNCKNCTHPILESAKFCSSCGQKNTDGRISIRSFFSAFFSTVFNLESKLFKTMGHIFIPGKLTVEYFKGKHIRYFHPVRIFIVCALLLIAAGGYLMKNDKASGPSMGLMGNIYKRAEKQVRKEKFLAEVEIISKKTLESFPNNTSIKPAFDSLFHNLKGNGLGNWDSLDMRRGVMPGDIDKLDFKISSRDLINFSPEALVEKYKIEDKYDRFIFKQKIRLINEKGGFAPFVLGNSLWIIFLMMPFLAFILKILYARRGYYYVEHLVFSFHTHAFAFLLFALILVILFTGAPPWIIAIGFFILFIYLYNALRKVYGQSRFITLVKLLTVNIIYCVLFGCFLVAGVLASMAMF